MTDQPTSPVLVAVIVAATAITGTACAVQPAARPTQPRTAMARPTCHPARAPSPQAPPPPMAGLLPFTTRQLRTAAALAGRFTTDYATHSPRQPLAVYLARLRPLATSQLTNSIGHGADAAGLATGRARQADTTTVTGTRVRDLTPGSVTITVSATQTTTSSASTSRAAATWAVTLIPRSGGWAVYDIEPVTAGNGQ